jgi:hypothetical protein
VARRGFVSLFFEMKKAERGIVETGVSTYIASIVETGVSTYIASIVETGVSTYIASGFF